MPNEITLGPRKFALGQPGIPPQGILLGSGGGFTWRFCDFVLLPDGSVAIQNYEMPGGAIPPNHETAVLLQDNWKSRYAELIDELGGIKFGAMGSPPLTATEYAYVLLVHKSVIHGVVWSEGTWKNLAPELRILLRDVRTMLARRFSVEHVERKLVGGWLYDAGAV